MKTQRRGLRALITVAAASLLLTACGPGAEGGDDEQTSEPQFGGTLNYAQAYEVASMDPAKLPVNPGAGGTPGVAVFDALLVIDADTGEVSPKLAESFTSDETGMTWTLTLRDGVTFSDGSPLDAEAVKINWERTTDPELGSPGAGAAAQITAMTAVSPNELRVELAAPDVFFDRVVAQQLFYIGSPASLQSSDVDTKPVGAGPFVLDEWVRDSTKTFSRNESYYDAPLPYADNLVIWSMPDTNQRQTLLRSGQVDLLYDQSSKDTQTLIDAGFDGVVSVGAGSPVVALNARSAPFDDERVRRAVRLAIGIEQAADVMGTFVGLTTPFVDGSPSNFGLSFPGPDQEAAQALFDEHASEVGGTVSFTLSAFQESANQAEAEYLQSVLNSYENVKVDVDVSANALTDVLTGNYQASTWGQPWWAAPDLDRYLRTGSLWNVSGYSNPEVDAALDRARTTLDEDVQNEALEFVVQTMIEEVPSVVYGARSNSTVFTDKIHGVEMHLDGYPYFERIWKSQ